MPDGLPPEIVEAMARALPTHVDDLSFIGDVRLRAASRVLAALPACVLVSDGQGNVTCRKELAEKPHGLGSGHDTTVTYDGQVQAFRYRRQDEDA